MKWFDNWFAKKCKQAWENEQNSLNKYVETKLTAAEPEISSEGMNFTVYKASGGYVFESRRYDSKYDRRDCKLYIITEDMDIGTELGKILTFESLRN